MQMGEARWGKNATPTKKQPKTKHQAIKLRKKSTPAERKLWALIRNDQLGVNFRRQHAVDNYIPDFVCIEKKLIVELDGLPSVAAFGTAGI
jgi:very-short-patch-repair endonuclease